MQWILIHHYPHPSPPPEYFHHQFINSAEYLHHQFTTTRVWALAGVSWWQCTHEGPDSQRCSMPEKQLLPLQIQTCRLRFWSFWEWNYFSFLRFVQFPFQRYAADPSLSSKGPLAVAVPGEIAGYWAARRRSRFDTFSECGNQQICRYGNSSISWERILGPSIRMAREGIPVSNTLADAIADKNWFARKP